VLDRDRGGGIGACERAVDAFKLRDQERISADDVYDILVDCA